MLQPGWNGAADYIEWCGMWIYYRNGPPTIMTARWCLCATSGPGAQLEASRANPQEGERDMNWERLETDGDDICLSLPPLAVMMWSDQQAKLKIKEEIPGKPAHYRSDWHPSQQGQQAGQGLWPWSATGLPYSTLLGIKQLLLVLLNCPHISSLINIYMWVCVWGLSRKSPTIVNIMRMICARHGCNLAAKESGLECAFITNDNFTGLVTGGSRCSLSERVYCVAVTCKMTEWVERPSASNFALSLNIPPWKQKLFGWFRRPQLWATDDWQLHHDNTPDHASNLAQNFLEKHQITQVTQSPYNPDLAPCDFCLFPKLKSPLKGKRFHTIDEIQENAAGQLMATGRTVWGPKVPTLKGTEASLSYVQCFLYLVSCLGNVSFS